jgi:2,3-bisphosphoglycerate-dependent phosphoglycerate mutase
MLTASLTDVRLSGIFSSPYPPAIQTAALIADDHGLRVEVIDDLRERLVSPSPLADWRDHLERSWSDFDYALTDGESSRTAQRRIIAVLDHLASTHGSGTLAVCSHGNLISLALAAFHPGIDFQFWEAMPMPVAYRLAFDRGAWRVLAGPGL